MQHSHDFCYVLAARLDEDLARWIVVSCLMALVVLLGEGLEGLTTRREKASMLDDGADPETEGMVLLQHHPPIPSRSHARSDLSSSRSYVLDCLNTYYRHYKCVHRLVYFERSLDFQLLLYHLS
jgi:hypothetical protein